MQELIDRLLSATGPDRELDCRIHAEKLRRGPRWRFLVVGSPTYDKPRFFCNPDTAVEWIGYDLLNVAPRYTELLDAAVQMVPLDHEWLVRTGVRSEGSLPFAHVWPAADQIGSKAEHDNPAIAMCAAALLARQVLACKHVDGGNVTEDQIKHMVSRFLTWRLPENFSPDGGVSFKKTINESTAYAYTFHPVGTNLLDAQQAEAMVRHMIEGMHR